jgi:hypothetical protein
VLKAEEPFPCIRCGKPFGVKSMIERVIAKLEGQHWMYQGSASRLDAIKMCEACRAAAVTGRKARPAWRAKWLKRERNRCAASSLLDAPVNKGNSGGPSFDVNGNVIGVNTAIFSPSGGSVGIGFDIPADTVKTVVAQLKDTGHVTRGWMGVQIQAVTADIADSLGLKKAEGAIVDEPQVDSPAAKAGSWRVTSSPRSTAQR